MYIVQSCHFNKDISINHKINLDKFEGIHDESSFNELDTGPNFLELGKSRQCEDRV